MGQDPGDLKKPHFIRLKSQAPMLFVALAVAHARLETHEEDGFVIIIAASDQGMVYINDRRHLVFSSKHARVWMRDNLDRKIAKELTLSCCQPTEDFECLPGWKHCGQCENQGLADSLN